MMTYKGYTARVEFDDENMIFHGEVIDIRDVVTFQGDSVAELEQAFHDSVDDYLAMCKERGEAPDKPFSGRFLVRVSPETHRRIHASAKKAGLSINAWLNQNVSHMIEGHYDRKSGTVTRATTAKPSTKARRKHTR